MFLKVYYTGAHLQNDRLRLLLLVSSQLHTSSSLHQPEGLVLGATNVIPKESRFFMYTILPMKI